MSQPSDNPSDLLLTEEGSPKGGELSSEARTKYDQAKTKELEDKNKHRYRYADIFAKIAMYSLVLSAGFLFLSGCNRDEFELSDTVLIAILGTALSTIFAPVYLLARYLFSNHKNDVSSDS